MIKTKSKKLKVESLENLRNEIDVVDEELLKLFARRLGLVERIGKVKRAEKLPVKDINREAEKLQALFVKAERYGLDEGVVERIWKTLFKISYIIEEND